MGVCCPVSCVLCDRPSLGVSFISLVTDRTLYIPTFPLPYFGVFQTDRAKKSYKMGHNSSIPKVDDFSQEEVSRLEKRFQKLDVGRSGSISIGEFVSVPELKENPLVKRVVEIFDSDLDGEVDFKEFVMGLAQFSGRESEEHRLQFIFRIYDIDRDGYISNGELFQVLKMMTGSNLTDMQLQQIVDKTIIYLDKDADGKISFDEFKSLVAAQSMMAKMSVDLSKI